MDCQRPEPFYHRILFLACLSKWGCLKRTGKEGWIRAFLGEKTGQVGTGSFCGVKYILVHFPTKRPPQIPGAGIVFSLNDWPQFSKWLSDHRKSYSNNSHKWLSRVWSQLQKSHTNSVKAGQVLVHYNMHSAVQKHFQGSSDLETEAQLSLPA